LYSFRYVETLSVTRPADTRPADTESDTRITVTGESTGDGRHEERVEEGHGGRPSSADVRIGVDLRSLDDGSGGGGGDSDCGEIVIVATVLTSDNATVVGRSEVRVSAVPRGTGGTGGTGGAGAMGGMGGMGGEFPRSVVFPVMTVMDPSLWWPHTHGHPYLYRLRLQVIDACRSSTRTGTQTGVSTSKSKEGEEEGEEEEMGVVVDALEVNFGVRQITTRVDAGTRGRVFTCNGVDVFIQGGNWIGTKHTERREDDMRGNERREEERRGEKRGEEK
jgi:hypothetical protein